MDVLGRGATERRGSGAPDDANSIAQLWQPLLFIQDCLERQSRSKTQQSAVKEWKQTQTTAICGYAPLYRSACVYAALE